MRPASFAYRAPATVEEVLAALEERPEDTSVLAGGQSLVPMLNMRVARPEVVVDLRRIDALAGISRTDGVLRIGAMTRQRILENDPVVRAAVPLVPAALRHVAHVAVRTRGTIGGSLVHADPSAELPAAVTALRGRICLRSRAGARVLSTEEFFGGALITALEPGELLEAVEIPVPPPGTGWGFREVASTHGAFALAGAAAVLRLDAAGAVEYVRVALMGVGSVPVTPGWLSDAMLGRELGDELLGDVASRLRDVLDPPDDAHASAAYRRRAASALALRALRDAAGRAGREAAAA